MPKGNPSKRPASSIKAVVDEMKNQALNQMMVKGQIRMILETRETRAKPRNGTSCSSPDS